MAAGNTIVVVDDEHQVVDGIGFLLAARSDCNVRRFYSPKQALDYVRSNEVSLVIADYQMPEMDGITFLGLIRKLRPDVPRVILAHRTDKGYIIDANSSVEFFQYVERPWNNDELLFIVHNGLEKQTLTKKMKAAAKEIKSTRGVLKKLELSILRTFV